MNIQDQYLQKVFQEDGSYRDLYITDVELKDWDGFLSLVRSSALQARLLKDGEEINIEDYRACNIFAEKNDHIFLLTIDFKGAIINCHFFNDNEIEFDVNPKELNSSAKRSAVIEFMQFMSNLNNKNVTLTPENLPGNPYLIVGSNGSITLLI